MRDSDRYVTRKRWLRGVALGAAVVVRELIRLQRTDACVMTENVLTLHVTPRTDVPHYYAIESRVAQLPGVRAAGFIQYMPLQNWGWVGGFTLSGRSVTGRPKPVANSRPAAASITCSRVGHLPPLALIALS